MTIRELFDRCYAQHWSQPRYQNSRWAKEVCGYWRRNIEPLLGDADVSSLGPKLVRDWHRSIPQPTTANRSLEVLSRLYTFAQEEELVPVGFNPCKPVKVHTERKRTRFATDEELAAVGKQLEYESLIDDRKVAFCEVLALTGARPSAIARAKRCDLVVLPDGNGILQVEGKMTAETGEQDSVIVPARAVERLLALAERPDGLLIGPVAYRRFWERITRNAGCPDLWLRDFRRLFATVGLSEGVTIGVIGELLNHRSSQTTMRYAKLQPAAGVAAVNTISARVDQLMKK